MNKSGNKLNGSKIAYRAGFALAALLLLAATPSVMAQGPDLVITSGSPTATPAQVKPGQSLTLSSWTVRNSGNIRATTFRNGFYLSTNAVISSGDLFLDGNTNSGLDPGQSFTWGGPTVTIPASVSPGTYYVGILVDRENVVAEANENNNYVSRQITVSGCPDLSVTSLAILEGTTVYPDQRIGYRLRAMARNIGTVDADSTFVGFYLSTDATITRSDRLLIGGREFIAHLGPGESGSISIYDSMAVPANYPTGPAYLGIIVDELGDISECNEANNTRAIRVTVGMPPVDLYISSGTPTATPSQVEPGEAVTLSSWTVRNGGGTASGPFQNGFYLSTDPVITSADRLLGNNSNSGLNPGQSWNWSGPTLTIPADVAPGTYYVGILTDRTNSVSERNENNNYVSRAIKVIGCPDIRVQSFTLDGGTFLERGVAMGDRMAAIVENVGAAAADTIGVAFYLSPDVEITRSDRLLIGGREGVAHLDPGASESVGIFYGMRVPDDYPIGDCYLGVIVDEYNSIDECDESNNTEVIRVYVSGGGTDLTIPTTPYVATPQMVQAGDLVTLSGWRIENIGTEPAYSIHNGFYFSDDSIITPTDTYLSDNYNSHLSGGDYFDWGGPTFRVPAGTPDGVYYMGVLVDMDNHIPESNENNNFVCARVVVGTPTDVEERDGVLPTRFALTQNYPNPFNPTTTIEFNLPNGAFTRLVVYNVLGQQVTTLVNETLPAGTYAVEWDGHAADGGTAPSGIYFYRLEAGSFTETRKMVLVK